MPKVIVDPGWAWSRPYEYSQAIRAGHLLILSGQVPADANGNLVGPGDIKGQAKQVFENIKTVLSVAGLTFDDLVEIVSYHVDIKELGEVAEVKSQYIRRDFPAWTAVGVTGLALPGQLLEIKAVALARGG